MPSVAAAGALAAPALFAAIRLGWTCRAVAGDDVEWIGEQLDVPVVGIEELIDGTDADVVCVATDGRTSHTERLLARGRHVLLWPGIGVGGAGRLAEVERGLPGSVTVAASHPSAPAVQAWFRELRSLGTVSHLSGATHVGIGADRPRLDWELCAVAVLSARLAGWGEPDGASSDGDSLVVGFDRGSAPLRVERVDEAPTTVRWNLQAAGPGQALRVELLPTPMLEHNGQARTLPVTNDPVADIGIVGMLRTLEHDLTTGRKPVLDLDVALTIERLLAVAAP